MIALHSLCNSRSIPKLAVYLGRYPLLTASGKLYRLVDNIPPPISRYLGSRTPEIFLASVNNGANTLRRRRFHVQHLWSAVTAVQVTTVQRSESGATFAK
jgi:hypothetical protein